MTIYSIYKPKNGDKKLLKVASTEPVPLSDGEKKIGLLSTRLVVINTARRRRNTVIGVLALLLVMVLAPLSIAGGVLLYRFINKPYQTMCDVPYHDGQTAGHFQEKVEIDRSYGLYEKLEVPPVLDSKRATVVHDFEKNLTAIVDRDRARCYIMNLNRTVVQPPRNFLDLLIKFQSGYYIPDTEVIREKYRVVYPEVEDLDPFGVYIGSECQFFETYRLIRFDEPIAMSRKRSASRKMLSGTFNLGQTMGKYVQFVEIVE